MSSQSSKLPTHTIGGVDYISLWDFTQVHFPAGKWKIEDQNVLVSGSRNSLEMTVNSREGSVNGMRVRLSAPLATLKGRVMIPKQDAFNGLLAIWSHPSEPDKVKRKRIVLDPGHGGENLGTRGTTGVAEKTLTLDLALRVERLLVRDGFEVILTRRKDVFLSLEQRAAISNRVRADAFVSLHFNWVSNPTVSGIETYRLPVAGVASTVRPSPRFDNGQRFPGNDNDQANELLASHVHRAVVADSGAADRGVRGARFAVLRETRSPAILLEAGYLSNRAEERQILKEGYREELAQAIARGIRNFCNSQGNTIPPRKVTSR